MLKHIFSTAGVRLSVAAMGLLVTTLNARFLGAEGLGEVRIFTVTVTLLIIVANFVGGPHLIYRVPRHSLFALLLRSYLWCIGVVALFFFVQFIPRLAFEHHNSIAISTLFYALGWVHVYVLIGMEKISLQNVLVFSFNALLLLGVGVGYAVFNWDSPLYFVRIYAVAAALQWLLGIVLLFINPAKVPQNPDSKLTGLLLKDGAYVQTGNLFQQLNYRIGDYILEATWGKAAVGVYGLAVQLAEGIWTVARSASLVQYARLSNMENTVRARKITFQLSKAVVVISAAGFMVLSIVPVSVYTWVFNADFAEVRRVIRWLMPVFSLYSAGFIYSHYFSSQGYFRYNTITSFVGLIVVLLAAPILIPRFGINGAIAAHSLTYLTSMVCFIYLLKRQPNRADRWMYPALKDVRWVKKIMS